MVVFLIPLISKQLCKNWELTTALLQGTLDSLTNQSDDNFRAIIICHEIPEIRFKGKPENFSVTQVKYSPFEVLNRTQVDKIRKFCTALYNLREEKFCFKYCMPLDADDRVNRNLVEYLNREPLEAGWIVERGYQVDYPSARVMEYDKLSQICGSTMILSYHVVIPQNYSGDEFYRCLLATQGHHSIKEYMAKEKMAISSLPLRGVQYILNHGINDSDVCRRNFFINRIKRYAKFWILGRKMSLQELHDFGYKLNFKDSFVSQVS